MAPLIFLDVDGVLNTPESLSRGGFMSVDRECVDRLNRITTETGARIVVSSSWRFFRGVANILMERGVMGEIIGTTTTRGMWENRGAEISAWLFSHPNEDGPIVILDDDDDMGDMAQYLVRTDYRTGLSDWDADRAIRMLS